MIELTLTDNAKSKENLNSFTSTGEKMFYHQEAMRKLRNGEGTPIVTHLMPTDICNHTCAFCSVLTRDGNSLTMPQMEGYLDQLLPLGLKSVIISGGGNPILYRCKETGANFNNLVDMVYSKGLEIGVITNGMKMKKYPDGRTSWLSTLPETLDKCKWIRISMSGLDHEEKEVFVPDIDKEKTTLGFSYVYHDIYMEPSEPNHGKVSTMIDLLTPLIVGDNRVEYGKDRLPWLTEKIDEYVKRHNPTYVRLLPNCLEVDKISSRCEELQDVANKIDKNVVFVQYKPPEAPNVCYLGYVHPVLNSDGYVYPCDSCVLNAAADHKFANPWRVCHWSEVAKIYSEPVRSLVDSKKICPGCVFTKTNNLLEKVRNGMETPMPDPMPTHPNFV